MYYLKAGRKSRKVHYIKAGHSQISTFKTPFDNAAMKRKNVKISGELDGDKVFEVDLTAANDDWMRAGRLKARADAGDKKAAAELKRMEETPMVEITDDEDPDN